MKKRDLWVFAGSLVVLTVLWSCVWLIRFATTDAFKPKDDSEDTVEIVPLGAGSYMAKVYWPKFERSPSELLLPVRIQEWCNAEDRWLVTMTVVRQRKLGEYTYTTEIWFLANPRGELKKLP